MPAWVNQGVDEYSKRLTGDIRFEVIELPLPKRGSASIHTLIQKEAALINKQLQKWPQAKRVALEVKGKRHSTKSLATRITQARDVGQDIVILIGGPDGLCSQLSQQRSEERRVGKEHEGVGGEYRRSEHRR